MDLFLLAEYLGQAVWSVVVASLLFGFHRTYRRHYLHRWALSWAALAIHHGANALGLRLVQQLPSDALLRICVSAVSLVAVYMAVAWLLLGTYEVATRRIAGRRVSRRLVLGAGLLGVLSLVVFVASEDVVFRMGSRIAVPEAITGLAFVASAVMVWRVRQRHAGAGPLLLCVAFLLYGALRFYVMVVTGLLLGGGAVPSMVAALGVLDLVLQSLIALGMAVWLFEEERRRALGAAAQLDRLSSRDALTEVMNRVSLLPRLEAACREAAQRDGGVVVAVVDLDRFQGINDSFGHSIGDELLRAVASRLRRMVGGGEGVARLGADEFLVLCPTTGSPRAAEVLASDVAAAFERPFELAGREVPMSATVGVSCFPDDALVPEDLVRHASLALVEARRSGSRFQRFRPGLSEAARDRLALEMELRRALEAGDLDLAFQPIVSMAAGEIVRVEALARWHRGSGAEVRPFRFLPVAEVIGLADELDAWVLRRALRQLALWRSDGHEDLCVAVNVSSSRFQDPALVQEVEDALREADVPAPNLHLEVTERVAMHRADASLYTMKALQRLGVGLSIDDFGTGYSSLSYLRRLPVACLKIDRSFVDDLDRSDAGGAARSIVHTIVALAHDLGLQVVGEGVETEQQWQILAAEGCDLVQGYYVAEPASAEITGPRLARRFLLPHRATG